MRRLLEYTDYAALLLPKDVSEELVLLGRRIQFICASFTDYDDDLEEIIYSLEDVDSNQKFLTELEGIYLRGQINEAKT